MNVHCQKNPEMVRHFVPLNLDTNKLMPFVQWANDETGEYCEYVRDEKGIIERQWENPKYRHLPLELWLSDKNEKYGGIVPKTIVKKGRIKIVNIDETNYEWDE